jgi:molybdenum cofactor cytidylyltransferase
MAVYGIVLASGLSVRMGEPKLLLSWKNQTIIEHVLSRLITTPLNGIYITIPKNNKKMHKIIERFRYSVILNPNPEFGMGYSLKLAVESLPNSAEAVIVLQGDQPTISRNDINRVVQTFQQLRGKIEYCPRIIIQMKYHDGRVGHPVLFSKHFFDLLAQISGDKGGRDIIHKNLDSVLLCKSENNYPPDIDTAFDYHDLINFGRHDGL